jgi:hypothetical protein
MIRYDEAAMCAQKAIELAPSYPMSYAWLLVAECERSNTVEAQRLVKRLAEILPGFTPITLIKLFDIFPDPVASRCIAALRDAGLIPVAET